MPETDWRPIDTDARDENPTTGETEYSWKWIQYNDDEIAIDLSDTLAEGETISGLTTHLWLLPALGEAQVLVDADAKLQGPPTASGVTVRQRISGLVLGRVYRLYVGVGDAGNHRNVTVVIEVVG